MDARLEQLYFPLGRDDDEEQLLAAQPEQREERSEDPDAWEDNDDEWNKEVEYFADPDSTASWERGLVPGDLVP
jgi:hypothetical protein